MSHEIVLFGKGKGKGTVDPKTFARRTVDYGSNVVRWLEHCLVRSLPQQRLQCHYSFTKELLPPFATPNNPYDAICCRFVHSATTKNRSPVNVVHWFPNGRRLITGSATGELTIWNGFQFHFENILQAHNAAIKAMEWTPEENILVTGDQLGVIKFWDQYMYNFQTFQAHKESMCDISVAPTGLKFCSCADDSHAKVWDLRTGEEERAFTGHGWDVRCCNWHPTKGLVATGSRDAQIKLWDPRVGEAITTIFSHKNTVTRVKWSPSGQYLASASRDQLVMLMDIRTMSVRKVFKAHQKEVTSLCWHPENDALLASGGYDSQLHFWDTYGSAEPLKSVLGAHEGPIWSLAWHPLGHLLASGSHDYSTRFWSRARPGDEDFDELLPKKIAAPGDVAAGAVPPPPVIPMTVLESGIFAGPPPKEAPLIHKLESASSRAVAAQVAEQAKLGLSIGEGENRKGILDVSDFDAEDQIAKPSLAITDVKEVKTAAADVSKTSEKAQIAAADESKAPEKAIEMKAFTKAAPQPAPVPKATETIASTSTESAKTQVDEEKTKMDVETKTAEEKTATKAVEEDTKPDGVEPKAGGKSFSKTPSPVVVGIPAPKAAASLASAVTEEETNTLKREVPPENEASDSGETSSKKPKTKETSGNEASTN